MADSGEKVRNEGVLKTRKVTEIKKDKRKKEHQEKKQIYEWKKE